MAALVLSELAVRLSGIADFPIYAISSDIGYIPAPSQAGRFLHENDWVYNEHSMGVARKWRAGPCNLLLIGNSVVMGGNVFKQEDKLGPSLQKILGDQTEVWPLGSGQWSNVNETAYLEEHQEVVDGSPYFIWEYMAGGLSEATAWQGPLLFPNARPSWATWYVAKRYLFPRAFGYSLIETRPNGLPSDADIVRFDKMLSRLTSSSATSAGIVFLYPSEAELKIARSGRDWLPERKTIDVIAATHHLHVVDVAAEPSWRASLYRDGTHPTLEGNRVLTEILASAFRQVKPKLQCSD
jgi:hypothetical protein